MRTRKLPKLSFAFFEPGWAKLKADVDPKHPLKYGELVIYLGDIPNSPSHCLVCKENGTVVWMIHTEDLREATEDEV
jgi:hypothetical protein